MAPKKNSAPLRSTSIGLALSRLRFAVVVCCWIVGLALVLQLVVWSLSAYTEVRFETQNATETVVEAGPEVVAAESPRQERIRQVREADMGVELRAGAKDAEESQLIASHFDGLFATAYDLVAGIGRYAMLMLIPLMMVGVVLCVGSATPGVERVVSSMMWGIIVAGLVLPLGGPFSLPWEGGALSTYGHMTAWVDRVEAAGGEDAVAAQAAGSERFDAGNSSLIMHGRFGLLPAAAIVGIALVGLRFCSGVEAGIIASESMRLDPELEREAANISPSSLHAGRTTGALSRTLKADENDSLPTARSVSAGDAPQRLI